LEDTLIICANKHRTEFSLLQIVPTISGAHPPPLNRFRILTAKFMPRQKTYRLSIKCSQFADFGIFNRDGNSLA